MTSDFRALQTRFGRHLRDPAEHAVPDGLEERRVAVYRDLVYRNVELAIRSAFPVLRRISSDAVWHARVRDFFARHACTAPQYNRIAEEFVHFLERERAHRDDPPFLAELAHYEWVEMALAILDEEAPASSTTTADVLDAPLCMSPLAWTLSYAWPVHRIGPDFQPASPPPVPTYLVVWRDAGDDVRFLELNAVTARLMQLVGERPGSTGRMVITEIAQEIRQTAASLEDEGRAMLQGLVERGCLILL